MNVFPAVCLLLLLGSSLVETTVANPFAFFRPTAPPPEDRDTIVTAQIYLDELLFGPGVIDGKLGEFTTIAARHYNQRWRVEEGNWHRLLREAQRHVKDPYVDYVIRESDLAFIGDLPSEPAEQAALAYLPYRTLAEFVAERYHTTVAFLAALNPDTDLYGLAPGAAVKVPNVSPFQVDLIKAYHQYEALEPLSSNRAIVDTKQKIVTIHDPKGTMLASFPITPGEERFIPYGEWEIQIMTNTPEFRYDTKMLEEGERGDEFVLLPPGPNSPVGIFWAGLSKSGIGLHGTSSPDTIGRSRSAGCIRLANWDALRLRSLLRPGAQVEVK